MEFFREEKTVNVAGMFGNIPSRVDSFFTTKLFMYAWIYSMAKEAFGRRTPIRMVPGAAWSLSIALTTALMLAVMLAGVIDYFIKPVIGAWKAASDFRKGIQVNSSHAAIALPIIFFIIWFVLG